MNRNPNGDPRLRGEFKAIPAGAGLEGVPEEREPLHLWSRLGVAAISLLLAGAILLLIWVLGKWAGGAW